MNLNMNPYGEHYFPFLIPKPEGIFLYKYYRISLSSLRQARLSMNLYRLAKPTGYFHARFPNFLQYVNYLVTETKQICTKWS